PYSAGQGSANDNAANIAYAQLDAAIRDTYSAHSSATNKNALYDSYIRAFRWAGDRIGNAGIMAFVTNAGWLDGNAAAGMRKCLGEEFSDLYIFHLRGNARTSGEQRRKEKGNVFGEGTRTPIVISVLVKNPDALEHGRIHFHDIGDYLDKKQKLAIIRNFGSIEGIANAKGWQCIEPDQNNDWLDQVNRSFDQFIEMGSRKDDRSIFSNYYNGVQTNRDPWAQNSSSNKLEQNLNLLINTYENDRLSLHSNGNLSPNWENIINATPNSIKWTRGLKARFAKNVPLVFGAGQFVQTLYRPFSMQWLYRDKNLNEYVNKSGALFPENNSENLTIITTGPTEGFSVVMAKTVSDVQTLFNGQCFPLYLYEKTSSNCGLFASANKGSTGLNRRYAITDAGLAHFQATYLGQEISKEDLFYYIYGLLHSPEYRERFANNLAKQLPRIPAVKGFDDFKAFRDAGRVLGDLHVNFETVAPYMVTFKEGDHRLIPEAEANPTKFYRVKKMRFGGKGKEKDRTAVIYNEYITMQNIPLVAYDYVINGKPALEWVMERQVVKTDKDSGIVNDANDYANETLGDPKYPMELFQRVITVSLETMKIVRSLPTLDI
ncbi:damage-inducible protein, partial [Paraburkholderia aspalathi]|nr:damage-inducible protein [Paraburkholderia aspalathi]